MLKLKVEFCNLASEYDPEPNPPYFTSYAIRATLDYLTSCHGGESLVSVLCKTKVNKTPTRKGGVDKQFQYCF